MFADMIFTSLCVYIIPQADLLPSLFSCELLSKLLLYVVSFFQDQLVSRQNSNTRMIRKK